MRPPFSPLLLTAFFATLVAAPAVTAGPTTSTAVSPCGGTFAGVELLIDISPNLAGIGTVVEVHDFYTGQLQYSSLYDGLYPDGRVYPTSNVRSNCDLAIDVENDGGLDGGGEPFNTGGFVYIDAQTDPVIISFDEGSFVYFAGATSYPQTDPKNAFFKPYPYLGASSGDYYLFYEPPGLDKFGDACDDAEQGTCTPFRVEFGGGSLVSPDAQPYVQGYGAGLDYDPAPDPTPYNRTALDPTANAAAHAHVFLSLQEFQPGGTVSFYDGLALPTGSLSYSGFDWYWHRDAVSEVLFPNGQQFTVAMGSSLKLAGTDLGGTGWAGLRIQNGGALEIEDAGGSDPYSVVQGPVRVEGGATLRLAPGARLDTPGHTLTIAGTAYLDGDFRIDANTALVLEPGAQLLFAQNAKLDVFGTLTADGATLKGQNGGIWKGLRFADGSTGTLANSLVERVSGSPSGAAIYAYNADVTLDNTTIKGVSGANLRGVYASGTNAVVTVRNGSEVFDHDDDGVYAVNGARIVIENSDVTFNDQSGVAASGNTSEAYVSTSRVNDNRVGLEAHVGAETEAALPTATTAPVGQNNEVRRASFATLAALGAAQLTAGTGSSSPSRNNDFTRDSGNHAFLGTGSTVTALYNYWGGSEPSLSKVSGSGKAGFSGCPYLTSLTRSRFRPRAVLSARVLPTATTRRLAQRPTRSSTRPTPRWRRGA